MAAADDWRAAAGCRLCGKVARSRSDKLHLPPACGVCSLEMEKLDSEWVHEACRTKISKNYTLARRSLPHQQ